MLRELRIENLLLIERAELRLGEGLNAITGETGAGKTVLAHSLDLLLGGRPRSAVVRPGAEEAWIEGTFDLPADLREDPALEELAERLPPEEEVTLARRVSASSGRSLPSSGPWPDSRSCVAATSWWRPTARRPPPSPRPPSARPVRGESVPGRC
jgi:DNA repair ATPase RecN